MNNSLSYKKYGIWGYRRQRISYSGYSDYLDFRGKNEGWLSIQCRWIRHLNWRSSLDIRGFLEFTIIDELKNLEV